MTTWGGTVTEEQVVFDTLTRQYRGPMMALAHRLLGNRYDAEDAVQSALIKAWRNLDQLSSPRATYSWLSTITRRECYSISKARKKCAPLSAAVEEEPVDS